MTCLPLNFRVPELNALLEAALAYARRFYVPVSFETPYDSYHVAADGRWHTRIMTDMDASLHYAMNKWRERALAAEASRAELLAALKELTCCAAIPETWLEPARAAIAKVEE